MSGMKSALLCMVAGVLFWGCGGMKELDWKVPAGGPVLKVGDLETTVASCEDIYDWLEGEARVVFISALACNSMSVWQLQGMSGKTAAEIVSMLDEPQHTESRNVMSALYLGLVREKGEGQLRKEVRVLVTRAFTLNLPPPEKS